MSDSTRTPEKADVLSRLWAVIDARRSAMPAGSYTVELLRGGRAAICDKLAEETGELIAAAGAINAAGLAPGSAIRVVRAAETALAAPGAANDAAANRALALHKAVIHEAADVLYHLLVLVAACDTTWPEVEAELARRFGVSGLAEKASRSQP